LDIKQLISACEFDSSSLVDQKYTSIIYYIYENISKSLDNVIQYPHKLFLQQLKNFKNI